MFVRKMGNKKYRSSRRLKAHITSHKMCTKKTYQTEVNQISSIRYNIRALFKARTSRAFSAFVSVITPTAAFAARIINMTYTNKSHLVNYCLRVELHTSFSMQHISTKWKNLRMVPKMLLIRFHHSI